MTVKVAGLWDFGWATPITEANHWIYPLRDFGVEHFYMCPITGIQSDSDYIIERPALCSVLNENPDLTVVFVDENGNTNLSNFIHPENALYILGKAGCAAMPTYQREGDLSVKIETPLNKGLLWPHQAISIVLYDRMNKGM